ncbi:hypothetical protein Pan153_02360 [Gimesia panareensis]|uniref:Uncharacterized protein n=1 Tax=Gimesia panareensis TaxID=2527978 RepID=A0A518FH34_9PLAN|nr:hypothetical protein Pan153_02360 [Gimesia panareensis]
MSANTLNKTRENYVMHAKPTTAPGVIVGSSNTAGVKLPHQNETTEPCMQIRRNQSPILQKRNSPPAAEKC